MKLKKKMALWSAIVLMSFVLLPVGREPVSAASGTAESVSAQAQLATEIYKQALEDGTVSYKKDKKAYSVDIKSFCLLDIDQNGTPELIVKDASANSEISTRYIYTVKDGKLKYCGNYSQRGQAELQYSEKYKSIYYWWWSNSIGGSGNSLLKIKNGKLKQYKYLFSAVESQNSAKMVYWFGSTEKDAEKVSKKKFDSLNKKYFKDFKTYSFYDNTRANIEKVLY